MRWRGFADYVYTTCARCQRKVPIADCAWDAGLLVCTDSLYGCKDKAINGSFEFREAREASRDRQELVPDEKLIHPVDVSSQLENLPASAGTYE
jgi:hypothetical protein